MLEIEETLHKQLFSGLSDEKFIAAWEDEIGPVGDEVCVASHQWKLPKYGRSTVYVFKSRMVAVCNARGKWAAFATKAWTDEREYFARWAQYCRGSWTLKVPQQEGVYPTKTLEGTRGKDRTLKRVEGRLKDITCCGGFVPYAEVTSWRAYWFEYPTPPLNGAL